MRATVTKWGNSLALRLPKTVADEVHLVEGATVTIEVIDGAIRVTPARKRFKLEDLLEGHAKSSEHDWGKPKGEEVW